MKYAIRLSLFALLLLLLAACSQTTVPQDASDAGAITLLSAPTELYKQMPVETSSIAFTDITLLINDFVIPAGETWEITELRVVGRLRQTPYTFTVRVFQHDLTPLNALNRTVTLNDSTSNEFKPYTFKLPESITLTAGTYWIGLEHANHSDWREGLINGQVGEAAKVWRNGQFSNLSNYDGLFSLSGSKTIKQTITFTSTLPNPALIGSTYTVTATGGASGNPVVFSAIDSVGVCTISGSTVSFVGIGTCTIAANQAGKDNYLAAEQATQSIELNTYGLKVHRFGRD